MKRTWIDTILQDQRLKDESKIKKCDFKQRDQSGTQVAQIASSRRLTRESTTGCNPKNTCENGVTAELKRQDSDGAESDAPDSSRFPLLSHTIAEPLQRLDINQIIVSTLYICATPRTLLSSIADDRKEEQSPLHNSLQD